MSNQIENKLVQGQGEFKAILDSMSGPGVIFGEPVREGNIVVIPSSRWVIRNGTIIARPHALIVISPKGVQIQPILKSRPVSILWALGLVAILGTIPVVFAPPWRPEFNLFNEVRRLILAIRGIDPDQVIS